MKIAVPTAGDQIDQHFGHCEKYSIFTIEDKTIAAVDYLASPAGCGCKSNMAATLAEQGVTILLAGGIGNGAVNVLAQNGIATIKGAAGRAADAVTLYLRGELQDRGDVCHEHGDGHVCQH